MDWNALAERYGDRVLLVCRGILRDDGLSRDAAQDAMVKLGRANGEVRDWDAFVVTVASNTARDHLRRIRRKAAGPVEEDVMDAATRSPEASAIARESRERVAAALEAMPVGDRDVLLLRFREGLSGPDIAKALGCSLEAAWQRISRALKSLRARLGD